MKKRLVTASALTLILGLTAANAEDKPMNHDMMKHDQMGKEKMDHGSMKHGMSGKEAAAGTGVIHSIDADKRVINLTHEPMPDLGWPTMTMDLPATKRVDLSGLKEGDKVDFKLKLGRDKKYRIIEIAPKK